MPILKKVKFEWFVKSTWSFIGLSILVLLIITVVWIFPTSEHLKKETSNLQIQLVEGAFLELRRFFDFQEQHLTHINFAISEIEDFQEKTLMLERFLGHQTQEIIILDNLGQEKIKVSTLNNLIPSEPKDYSRTKGFLRSIKGEVFFENVFWENGIPFIEITGPIRSPKSEVRGVLVSKINLTFLWDALSEIRLGETGIIYVVDKNGELIFHAEESPALKEVNLLDRIPVNTIIKESIKIKGLSREDFYTNEKGMQVHVAGMLLPELHWAILFEQDTGESYAVRNQLTLVAASSLAVGFLLSYFLARLISKLTGVSQDLKEAKVRLEEEKLGLEIRVKTRTKELKGLTENLDEKIRERTKELEEKIEELEKFQQITVGRELKMVELKQIIEELKNRIEKMEKQKLQ